MEDEEIGVAADDRVRSGRARELDHDRSREAKAVGVESPNAAVLQRRECHRVPGGITCQSYRMRVTQKGQVTIPVEVRRALGIHAGSNVQFELEENGARLFVDRERAPGEIARLRGAGSGALSTDEILALTRG